MIHSVVQVVPKNNYKVHVYFDDGKVICYDANAIIKKGVFSQLIDEMKFKKSCKILNDTLAFDIDGTNDESKCFDIDPVSLYESKNIII